jgi:hypothetical protein
MARPRTNTKTGTLTMFRQGEILTARLKEGLIIKADREFKRTFPGTSGQPFKEFEPFVAEMGWVVIFRSKDDE